MNAHETWKFIEAVFVPPGVPHPQWRLPIGKQLIGAHRSTTGFMRVISLLRKRQWEDQSVNGTYQWGVDRWVLVSETDIKGLDLRCPESLPGDIEVVPTEDDDSNAYWKKLGR